jgi:serine protease AprX
MNENNLITYEDLPIKEKYIVQIQSLGIKIQNKLNWFNSVSAYLTSEQLNEVKELYFVEKIEKVKSLIYKDKIGFAVNNNYIHRINKTTDFDYGPSFNQYSLSDIPKVQNKGINGAGVLIGLLDTGFDWKTPEALKGVKVIAEHDFIFNDNNTSNEPNDVPGQDGHGTYVFSIIAGNKPGEIIGPVYEAGFILAKTENIGSETHQEEDNYAAALEWMEGLGVDITSSSLGYSTFDPGQISYIYKDMNGETTIVTKAADLAFQRGVVVVCSAGNEGNTSWHYITAPADGFNVIAVGAVNNLNQLAAFSSRGPTFDGRIKPDVLTQGVYVYGSSAHSQNNYTYGEGTSASCPIASGIAGLILSVNPNLTNIEVRKIMLESCDNFNNPDNDRGYGLLSADKAISIYYPNVNSFSGIYQIEKKLFAKNEINIPTCKIHYSINGKNLTVKSIPQTDNNIFIFSLTDFKNGDILDFYYTYSDNSGNNYQDPVSDKTYKYTLGTSEINLGRSSFIPDNYFLSNNYPNPFNNETSINFFSIDFNYAELNIYNSIGQRVRNLYNNLAKPGINTVTWNGTGNSGTACASGIYYYVLKINGQIFSKKMVLLK